MNKKENNLTSLDQYIEQQYGKRGTSKREKFESGYENFKIVFFQSLQKIIEAGLGGQLELAIHV